MKRMIIATAATLAFGGLAIAQESPAILYDDVYGNVTNQDGAPGNYGPDYGVDYRATASIDDRGAIYRDGPYYPDRYYPGPRYSDPTASANFSGTSNINMNDNYSGK